MTPLVASELPTLVLLPGMDGTGDLFEPLAAAIGDRLHVQVLRYPVAQPLGYDELEALVRSQLPTDRPFMLLGESFSGPLAIAIAADPPPGLVGLVLCCTFTRNPRPTLSWLAPWVNWLPLDRLPLAPAVFALLGRDETPALTRLLVAAMRAVGAGVLRARLLAVLQVDVRVALLRVRVPVFSLRASEDRVVPVEASVELLQGANVTELVLNGPHGLLQVATWEAAAVLREFAVDLAASSGLSHP